MQSTDLLSEGINLMIFGMGFVFVFLILLVFATTLMSKVISMLPEEPQPAAKPAKKKAAAPVSEDVVAAIAAAIKQHRQARA